MLAKVSSSNASSVFLCLLILVVPHGQRVDAKEGPRFLDFRLPASVSLGEPVELTISIENDTDSAVTADFGFEKSTMLVLHQRLPSGLVTEVKPKPKGPSFGARYELAPRQKMKIVVVLDEWLRFSAVGTYEVNIEFIGPVTSRSGAPVPVQREYRQTLEVGPRDPERLRTRCEEWLKVASTARVVDDQESALRALQFTIDPVAVPFLVAAIERRQKTELVDTLRRIATPDARSALQRLAQSTDASVRTAAITALGAGRGRRSGE